MTDNSNNAAPATREDELIRRVDAICAPLRAAIANMEPQSIDIGEVEIAVRRLDALRDDLEQGLVL